jgi:SAM-dependent methyltransferase
MGASDPSRNPEDLRGWGCAAVALLKWWSIFERGAQPVSDRLLDLAHVQLGARVLDVATGVGEPALSAARRVGPTGRVVATDLSPGALAAARERAAALGLSNVEFRAMDAESPNLPEETFDAVLSRWGLMFLTDLQQSLERLRRLLVPGGRLAAAVWDAPHKVPLIHLRDATLERLLGEPALPPGAPHPCRLADLRLLEHTLEAAGFRELRAERFTMTVEFPSAEAYARFQEDVAGPRRPALARLSPERRADVWRAVAEAARAYASATGAVRLPNQVLCIAGRR